uniref:Brix domain-containing protein n=1 Tax=Aureoumbra lagunensis TaxID=44058 RepID=A0A7S3NH39_9STRA|mmetsp:Transcript_629/g.804  ORF Transcript_629/g.804 Transcript_629/m.804 type:complete len:376 (+) Transcript_629:28-1155(+)|eukprot:CAMPEP_0197298470 /NCGR_PEP_ID=MMETSP0890-20130614/43605_1 /TAXON_ID=44058 ORGANISM="Aureoumbra lagunensis, Strain CCMP1510" /NCGR_SAMPLE_ID=MMETSP0890 /ASSEMBLY_ACC=CAM_ASM_000533 /LENGTH=375 /DNA_ID=CAMNT_0042776253 /DNA_START=9 /DNA_END=1136 /DNA_ORIENTATION=-
MPRKGGRRKKRRTQPLAPRPGEAVSSSGHHVGEETELPPRSMIVRRGKTGKAVTELVRELRRVMAPNTAERLRERAGISIRDLAEAGVALKVSHLILVSESSGTNRVTLRIARLPQGPTLEFQVMSFQLSKHVRKEQDQPYETPYIYATAPLLVLSGLAKATQPETKLTRATLQALFPAMDVTSVKLNECRRAALCAHKDDGLIDLRHYAIQTRAAGVSKPIRDVVLAKKTPDLSKLKHVAQYIDPSTTSATQDVAIDESNEVEHQVELDPKFLGKNISKRKSAITLAELGPRLTLKLIKVQKGLCDGAYLFNAPTTQGHDQQPPTETNQQSEKQIPSANKKRTISFQEPQHDELRGTKRIRKASRTSNKSSLAS